MDDFRQEARALVDMALTAMAHAFRCIEEGDAPLTPFVMTDSDGEGRAIYRFEAKSLGHALDSAEIWLDGVDAEVFRYAFVWDGYITLDDGRWDALFVEAGDRVLPHGMLLCQRYAPESGAGSVNRRVGGPILVEKPDSRLAAVPTHH